MISLLLLKSNVLLSYVLLQVILVYFQHIIFRISLLIIVLPMKQFISLCSLNEQANQNNVDDHSSSF